MEIEFNPGSPPVREELFMSRLQRKMTTWAGALCLLAALCVLPAPAQDQTGTSQGSSQTGTANDQTSSTTTKKKRAKKAKKDQAAADQAAGSVEASATTNTTTATSKSKKGKNGQEATDQRKHREDTTENSMKK